MTASETMSSDQRKHDRMVPVRFQPQPKKIGLSSSMKRKLDELKTESEAQQSGNKIPENSMRNQEPKMGTLRRTERGRMPIRDYASSGVVDSDEGYRQSTARLSDPSSVLAGSVREGSSSPGRLQKRSRSNGDTAPKTYDNRIGNDHREESRAYWSRKRDESLLAARTPPLVNPTISKDSHSERAWRFEVEMDKRTENPPPTYKQQIKHDSTMVGIMGKPDEEVSGKVPIKPMRNFNAHPVTGSKEVNSILSGSARHRIAPHREQQTSDKYKASQSKCVTCGKQFKDTSELTFHKHYSSTCKDKLRDKDYEKQLEVTLREKGVDQTKIRKLLQEDAPKDQVDKSRPTYTRMSRRHLSIETLNQHRIDYEFDVNPDYLLIKRWVPEYEQDFLWSHTRQLREERRAIALEHPQSPDVLAEDSEDSNKYQPHGTDLESLKSEQANLPGLHVDLMSSRRQAIILGRNTVRKERSEQEMMTNIHYTISKDNTDENARNQNLLKEFGRKIGCLGRSTPDMPMDD